MQTIELELLSTVTGAGPLRDAGHAFGFGAGVAVTGALSLVPGWNRQVPGAPPGFQRRHEAVAGPAITNYANRQSPGGWRDFTAGVGAGATAAPGWSFEHGI